jgi:Nuclear pore protein 84 / 107
MPQDVMNDPKDEDDDTARAVAAIESQLKLFTSPWVAGTARGGNDEDGFSQSCEIDDWMSRELREEPLATKSPKRTPMLERADTPVMSNKAGPIAATGGDEREDDGDNDDDDLMRPVETPVQRRFERMDFSSSSSSSSLNQLTFRRYHDALWGYLHAKNSVNSRMALEQEERLLGAVALDSTASAAPSLPTAASLAQQESRVETDYCKTLCQLAYALPDETSMDEGHLWSLLAVLRKLGPAALIWHDDSTSSTQNASAHAFYMQNLSTQIHFTAKELLDALEPPTALTKTKTMVSFSPPPLMLQRKHQLAQWIQSCVEQEGRTTKKILPTTTSTSPTYPDDPSLPSLVSEADASFNKILIETCLDLVLQGRIDAARDLVRAHGQPWRAAAWLGGEPAGYQTVRQDDTQTVARVPVGNPNRFLWKRRVWRTGQRLAQQGQGNSMTASNEEAAIYSILANDVTTALSNPCLRTSWTKSLCVLILGAWGRVQDEILHKHNSNRRRNVRPAYPGSQYEQEENEQMVATGELGNMTEAHMAATLHSNRFLQQQRERREGSKVSYKSSIMSFIVGRSAILDFCQSETTSLLSSIKEAAAADTDWRGLRFLTHLMLFLHSLQDSRTPIVLDDLTTQKDLLLSAYVRYLESRPDLWHMLALYVSFLPAPKILEYFPSVLVKVLDENERKLMMNQIRQLIPALELPLLRQVVRSSLAMSRFGTGDGDSLDAIKCNSLQWLLQHQEHFGDALICSNILLRQFFLNQHEDKIEAAAKFLRDYLPQDLVDRAGQTLPPGMEDDLSISPNPIRAMYECNVSNARAEHLAYVTYLDAYKSFGMWKELLRVSPATMENQDIVDTSKLNQTEQEIASQSFRRWWIREKKRAFESMVEAAEAARLSLYYVLTHPGGWLSTDDEDDSSIANNEVMERQRDIGTIRSRHLVLVVNLYHQVCKDTASWISRSLDDAGNVGASRDQALAWMVSQGDDGKSVSFSSFSPDYWYQQALDLASLIADDTFGIYKAFAPVDLMDFLSIIEETAVSQLMNSK